MLCIIISFNVNDYGDSFKFTLSLRSSRCREVIKGYEVISNVILIVFVICCFLFYIIDYNQIYLGLDLDLLHFYEHT